MERGTLLRKVGGYAAHHSQEGALCGPGSRPADRPRLGRFPAIGSCGQGLNALAESGPATVAGLGRSL